MMRGAVLAALLAGCWTGPDAPPPAAPAPPARHHANLEITLERTACMGMCPVYKVVIRPSGDVEWTGVANVAEIGVRHGHVSPARLDELARALARVQFDARGEDGGLPPPQPVCTTVGNVGNCSVSYSFVGCSDTPHAIITVRRGGAMHRVDDAHCDASPLDALEQRIDEIAHTAAWIGR